jgi:mono/diheme cytochrome c family protein
MPVFKGFFTLALVLTLPTLASCGGGEGDGSASEAAAGAAAGPAASEGLTPEQLEKGVGPITNLELAALDPELAATGEETFIVKCSACHKMDDRYVGPPLRDVTQRRTPEFVMNMILNPEGMVAEHPEVRALLAQYAVPMANQNLTEDDARAVLEYLRREAAETPAGS